jgi:hypothetical protein
VTFSKLGTDKETGQLVYLPKTARVQGLYIVGLQGMGKSGLISNLVIEDIKQGTGVCVLDPKRDLIDSIIARLPSDREKDVILLDVADEDYPFGLNLFECPNLNSTRAVQIVVDQVMHIFEKLLKVSEETQLILEYLINCTITLVANQGYTMAEIPLLLTNKNCRQKLVANVNENWGDSWGIDVLGFWEQYEQKQLGKQSEEIASILRRVRRLLQPVIRPFVGQAKTTIDLQKIMDERKIFLVKLDRQMPQVTTIVGSILVALILKASAARQTQRQFHLYADEFQRFATDDFATLLEEARYAAIGITMAHQNRAQLEASDKRVEEKLKDRTLNVGSIVVFYVPTDAEELAGQFDTTPPPAWEEELEEESVEVLEEEWFERVEEEVIDGEEEIQTPVKDVVGHLLRGGSHPSPVVNDFVHGWLQDFDRFTKGLLPPLNTIFYNAMLGREPHDTFPPNFLHELFHYGGVQGYGAITQCLGNAYPFEGIPEAYHAFIQYWLTDNSPNLDEFYTYVKEYIRIGLKRRLTEIISNLKGYPTTSDFRSNYDRRPSEEELRQLQVQADHQDNIGYVNPNYHRPDDFFQIDVWQLDWELVSKEEIHHVTSHFGVEPSFPFSTVTYWQPKPGQEDKFIDDAELDRLVEEKFEQSQADLFEERIAELKDVMEALAEHPLAAGSGIRQPRKRKQINILTHPRQIITHPRIAITHPQPTSAEMEKKNENQLLQLDLYQAWVKMKKNDPKNPGKKCMKCGLRNANGARYCVSCDTKLPAPNEYIIKTIEPEQGLYGKVLQARIERIQENNRKPDQFGHVYCRSRQEVEAEITKRQQNCSGGSAPAQPQKQQQPSPQQASHARQVPVKKNCPNCGTQNNSNAIFCNQCGTKLI